MAAKVMVAVDEAIQTVLQETEVKEVRACRIDQGVGKILAEDVEAQGNVPDRPLSVKDGFAINADSPSEFLSIVGETRAGNIDESIRITPGTAAYITTGSAIPEGANAVAMIEDTAALDQVDEMGRKRIKLNVDVKPGQDVRGVGTDIARGETVLRAGKRIDAADVGILATLGIKTISVYSLPKIAFMSTGDEVVDISSDEVAPHQIRDANRPMLVAASKSICEDVVDLGIAGDKEEDIESLLQEALRCKVDVLVTSGGVSMGDRDFVKPALERKGKVFFGKVKMKPGKPLTFATIRDPETDHKMLVFGLPGNPVSSYVTFTLVVIPTLRKMSGWARPHLRRIRVRTADALSMDSRRPEYHRAVVKWCEDEDGEGEGTAASKVGSSFVAHSTGNQVSSRLVSMRGAHVLLEVPQGDGTIPPETVVTALVIGDFCVAT